MSNLRTVILVASVAALLLTACKSETPAPAKDGEKKAPAAAAKKAEPAKKAEAPKAAAAAGGAEALLGNWAGDVEALKKQDPSLEKNPMAKMIFGMLGTMKVEFTKDTMNIEVMGQKKSAKYKVVSSDKSKVVIEATDGKKAGTKTEITFIDATHVALKEVGGKPGPPMVLKRL